MVTSGYATLAGFIAALQFAAALWALAVGLRSVAATAADESAAERLEARTYLGGLLAYLLLGTSLVSWLVLYLMLESFVPQWKGAMCIYGVTQIGSGSLGIYRWLPRLIMLEQGLKPLLIFVTGAALVVYRLYRRQGTQMLLPRVATLLLLAAALAACDAGIELAYLAIPKRESLPNSGCCSVSSVEHDRTPLAGPPEQRQWTTAFFASQALMALLLMCGAATGGQALLRRTLPLVLLAAVTLGVAVQFLIHVASPTLLHLPYHHCIYDLITQVPESGVATLLLFAGTCCVGWAAVVSGVVQRAAPAEAGRDVRYWLAWSLLGYVGFTAMISLDLWLA